MMLLDCRPSADDDDDDDGETDAISADQCCALRAKTYRANVNELTITKSLTFAAVSAFFDHSVDCAP